MATKSLIKSVLSDLAKNAIEALVVALLVALAAWLVVTALGRMLLFIMTAGLEF